MSSVPGVQPHALKTAVFDKLSGKRVILASASPRRRELLATVGLLPEVVPSTFAEDLPHSEFRGDAAYEYPVETACNKALEVYKRVLEQDQDNPPDLVIAADTVVLKDGDILEKPKDQEDYMRMLLELNDGPCEVVTGVALVHPILTSPGYQIRRLSEKATVHFAQNPPEVLTAYVKCGEGQDRAGGFAIQGLGSLLVKGIEGDFNTVVGFPIHSFFAMLHELVTSDEIEL